MPWKTHNDIQTIYPAKIIVSWCTDAVCILGNSQNPIETIGIFIKKHNRGFIIIAFSPVELSIWQDWSGIMALPFYYSYFWLVQWRQKYQSLKFLWYCFLIRGKFISLSLPFFILWNLRYMQSELINLGCGFGKWSKVLTSPIFVR